MSMIKTPEVFTVPTLSSSPLNVTVNWNKHSKKSAFVKLEFEGKQIIVPRSSFIRAALYIGDADEQDRLIPTTTVKVKQFRKTYTITLKKDLKQGEQITIPITFDIPLPQGIDELPIIIH